MKALVYSTQVVAYPMTGTARAGYWRVLFDLPHIFGGKTYDVSGVYAVVDDFGNLVVVADDSGSVVLR